MFGSGKPKPPPIRSLVCEGTVVHGDIAFVEGIRIDGDVEGDVTASGDARSLVVISEKARVQGKVKAAHVIINGDVCGAVDCSDLLELQPGACVVGDVRYALLEMHPGARVAGELKPLKFVDRPSLKLAASNEH